MEQSLESWRRVWRNGFAPLLSVAGLEALRGALTHDDPGLLQGVTTNPPPLVCVQGFECDGGCAISFCGWKGEGLRTVGEVEEYFARLCLEADLNLGAKHAAECRWFLNWFDDTPRAEMRRELLAEVVRELGRRAADPVPEMARAAA